MVWRQGSFTHRYINTYLKSISQGAHGQILHLTSSCFVACICDTCDPRCSWTTSRSSCSCRSWQWAGTTGGAAPLTWGGRATGTGNTPWRGSRWRRLIISLLHNHTRFQSFVWAAGEPNGGTAQDYLCFYHLKQYLAIDCITESSVPFTICQKV